MEVQVQTMSFLASINSVFLIHDERLATIASRSSMWFILFFSG